MRFGNPARAFKNPQDSKPVIPHTLPRLLSASSVAAIAIVLSAWAFPCPAQTVVGIVEDGPEPRSLMPVAQLETEIRALFGDEFDIELPADKRLNGGWTLAGVRAALRQSLDDPEVDIVIAMGMSASHHAARIADLPKPVIAAFVADAQLQDFPAIRRQNRIVSGKDNFAYLASVRLTDEAQATPGQTTVDEAIEVFHDAVGFGHLTIIVDRLTLESIPVLASSKAREIAARLDVRTSIVAFEDTVPDLLDSIPEDADAVFVGPLLRLDDEGVRALADGLIRKRLPSFSILGRAELGHGLLMASSGRAEDFVRYTRRLALNIQRILLGEEPGDIDVRISEPQRLAINMRTANAIGFYPRYAVLADAEQLYAEALEAGEPLSLAEAMAEALEANLNLSVAAVDPLLAGEDVRLARSGLLPQLGVDVRAVRIDEDRANPLVQPERSVDAEISGSQVLYSDDTRAALVIARFLDRASDFAYQTEVLNTLQAAAQDYITVLQARALETVRRSNLEVTRANLELARLRLSIGASGRADVLRWESELATDRQDLVAAEADSRIVLTAFNQTLNRPQNRNFTPADEGLTRSIALFQEARFRALIDNAAVWALFQDFSVRQSLAQSPELRQADQIVAAQERQVLAAKRRYYVPELTLGGSWGSNLDRGGAGSDVSQFGLDDESWSIGLSASWPLFSSGALRARLNQDRYSLMRTERSRRALAEQLETRTRVALQQASGSYPSLEFSAEAAEAAGENLDLVTDAYRRGAVSVTDLIDAQNAALAARLRAVDARYVYLADVVDILRATGDFSLLVDPGSIEAWFQQVEAYIREHRDGADR